MRIHQIIFYFSILFIGYSCSKDNDPSTPSDPIPVQEEKDTYEIHKQSYALDKTQRDEPYFLVGYGYDATKNQLYPNITTSNSGIKSKILDLEKFDDLDSRLDIMRINSSEVSYLKDVSKQSVLNSLTIVPEFDRYKDNSGVDFLNDLPDAGIDVSYGMVKTLLYRLYLPTRKDYSYAFSESFVDHIANSSPEEIVEQFGTHIIVECKKGYSYKTISFLKNETSTPELLEREWGVHFISIGGDPSKIQFDEKEGTIGMEAWQKSFTEDNADFLGFDSEPPLLYSLLPEGPKKEELKKYIDDYLKK